MRVLLLLPLLFACNWAGSPEEERGVRYANRCETCKILATELQDRLQETGKSHDVIVTGYSLDDVKPKKRTAYRRSELRLLESLENICERILRYNLHKERSDSTRFAKGMSQTFQALHGLVAKGVKVELGIPHELWDKPPVEVTQMKTQCEDMLEEYEDSISDWYFKLQEAKSLTKHLCEEQVLQPDEQHCLTEVVEPKKWSKKGDDEGDESEDDVETEGDDEDVDDDVEDAGGDVEGDAEIAKTQTPKKLETEGKLKGDKTEL